MSLYGSLIRSMTKATDRITDLRKVVEAGKLSKGYDLSDGMTATADLIRFANDQGLGDDLAAAYRHPDSPIKTPRQRVMAEFFLTSSSRKGGLSGALGRLQSTNMLGAEIDVVEAMAAQLSAIDKRALGVDLDLSDYRDGMFVGPPGQHVKNQKVRDVLRSTFAETLEIPEGIRLGSEQGGKPSFMDIESKRVTDQAHRDAANMGEPNMDTSVSDLFGEKGTPTNQRRVDEEMADVAAFFGEGRTDTPTTFGPTFNDYAASVPGSDVDANVRAADPNLPDMVISSEDLGAIDDPDVFNRLVETIRHTEDVVDDRPPRKLKPASRNDTPKPQVEIPTEDDLPTMSSQEPLPPKGPGTPLDPPRGPKTPDDFGEPSRPNTAMNGWRLMKESGLMMLQDPEYALPKRLWKPIRSAWNKTHDWDHAWNEQMKRVFHNVREGSPEAEYIGLRLDVTGDNIAYADKLVAKTDEKVAKIQKDLDAAGGPLPSSVTPEDLEFDGLLRERAGLEEQLQLEKDQLARHSSYSEHLREGQRRLAKYRAEMPTGLQDDLERRADGLASMYQVAGRLIGESRLPQAEKFKNAGGTPIKNYFTHLFRDLPEWIDPTMMHKNPDGSIEAKFLLPREGAGGYSWDAVTAAKTYFPTLGRKLYLEPVFKKFTPWLDNIEDADEAHKSFPSQFNSGVAAKWATDKNPATNTLSPQEHHYLGNWLMAMQGQPNSIDTNWIGAKHAAVQKLFEIARTTENKPGLGKFGKRVRKFGEDLRATQSPSLKLSMKTIQLVNRGALGASLGFALKNVVQPAWSIADKGVLASVAGIRSFYTPQGLRLTQDWNLSREFVRFLDNETSASSTIAEFLPEGRRSDLSKMSLPDAGRAFGRMVDKVLYAPGAATEFMNRGVSTHIGIVDGLAKRGLTTHAAAREAGVWEEVLEEAIAHSDQVNFMYGVAGRSPYITRSPGLVNSFQFTQYHHKMWQMMADQLYNQSRITPFIQFSLLTGWATSVMSRGLDVDISGWMGLPGLHPKNLISGERVPLESVTGKALFSLSGAFIAGTGEGNPAQQQAYMDEAKRNLAIMAIPAYLQMSRVQRTLKARQDGYWSNRRGTYQRQFTGRATDWLYGLASGFPTTQDVNRNRFLNAQRRFESHKGMVRQAAGQNLAKLSVRMMDAIDPKEQGELARQFENIYMEAVAEGVPLESVSKSFDYYLDQVLVGRAGGVPLWMEQLREKYPETLLRLDRHAIGGEHSRLAGTSQ